MNCPHCGYPDLAAGGPYKGIYRSGHACDSCGFLETGGDPLAPIFLRIGSAASEGEADNYVTVKPDRSGAPFHGLIRALITNERNGSGHGPAGDLIADCSLLLASLELRCRCAFGAPRLAIPLLAAYGGVEICGLRPAAMEDVRFLGEVKMSDGRAEVTVDGRRVPLMSVEVAIEPNVAVEAVITSDFQLREEWPPDLCQHLLTAMGYEWRELRAWPTLPK